jgi:hypothetical protein
LKKQLPFLKNRKTLISIPRKYNKSFRRERS